MNESTIGWMKDAHRLMDEQFMCPLKIYLKVNTFWVMSSWNVANNCISHYTFFLLVMRLQRQLLWDRLWRMCFWLGREKLQYQEKTTEKKRRLTADHRGERRVRRVGSHHWFFELLELTTHAQMPKWPFWAAAPKGRCPVGHRGEFPYVRPSVRTYVHPPPIFSILKSHRIA